MMNQEYENKSFSFWLWILIPAILLLYSGLWKMPLYILDEVRNAQCAKEMMQRNDWVVPTFNQELRTDKPPLHYYFMRAGYALFGTNAFGARFFSGIMGLLTLWITWFFVKRFSTTLHALVTCLILMSSWQFIFEFRLSVPDPYLIFFITLTLFGAFSFFMEKRFYWLLFCGVAMGLGILAKGPVAIALPGASVLLWLIWEKKWKLIFSWKILAAGLVVIVVALPWYLAVDKATNGEWTQGFFIKNNLERFSGSLEGHGGLFVLVPLFILLGLLPFTVFIGEVFRGVKKRFGTPLMRLALSVTMVFLVFFSFSGTKLPNYVMPCYGFVAILLGSWVSEWLMKPEKPRFYPYMILLVINLVLPFIGYYALKSEVALRGYESLALTLIWLPVTSLSVIYLLRKYRFPVSIMALVSMYAIFHLFAFSYLYPKVYLNNPMSKTIDDVRKYDQVVGYKFFNSAYVFYIDKPIKQFWDYMSLEDYLRENPNTVIITRKDKVGELVNLGLKTVAEHHDLFELPTTVLLTNNQ